MFICGMVLYNWFESGPVTAEMTTTEMMLNLFIHSHFTNEKCEKYISVIIK